MPETIGVIQGGTRPAVAPFEGPYVQVLEDALKARGLDRGTDYQFQIEYLNGNPLAEALGALTRLKDAKAKAIVTMDALVTRIARDNGITTPIVWAVGDKQADAGAVRTYRAPGGTMTGLTGSIGAGIARLDLFNQVLGASKKIAVLLGPNYKMQGDDEAEYRTAAAALGVGIADVFPIKTPSDIPPLFDRAHTNGWGITLVPHSMFSLRPRALVELEQTRDVPVVYPHKRFVELGGLCSWGPDLTDLVRRSALYVERIMRGKLPGELPMQGPIMESAINFDMAKTHTPAINFPGWIRTMTPEINRFGTP